VNTTPQRRRGLAVIGVTLLLATAAACGSDSDNDTTDTATDGGASVTDEIGTDTTADTSAAAENTVEIEDTVDTVDPLASLPSATAEDDREAVIEYLDIIAAAAGIELDEVCVAELVGQLSDDDAALLGDSARAGGEGDPELSAEGEAIGDELQNCAVADTSTTTG
jgi:hypothetical protein